MEKIILAIFTFIFFTTTIHAQKAYDIIQYTADNEEFNLKFKLADGYNEASAISIKDKKAKINAKFIFCLDEAIPEGQHKFCISEPSKWSDKSSYVILFYESESEKLPDTIKGNIFHQGKPKAILLKKVSK